MMFRITSGAPSGGRASPELSSSALTSGAFDGGGTAEAPPLSDSDSGALVVGLPVVTVVGVVVVPVPVPETLTAPVAAVAAASRSTAALTATLIRWIVVPPATPSTVRRLRLWKASTLELRPLAVDAGRQRLEAGDRRGPPVASRRRRRSSPSGGCDCRTAATPRVPERRRRRPLQMPGSHIATSRAPLSSTTKRTPSLSCAYGVSCRARAERACATPQNYAAIRPKSPLGLNNWVPPLPAGSGDQRLGWVCWRGITVRQYSSAKRASRR